MREILEAIVGLLESCTRETAECNDIDGARAKIYSEACRAAAAEIRGALIRAERI